jgi:hypothetical protein
MEDGVGDKKDFTQSPSVVLFQDFHRLAKPAKNEYRRNPPHLQVATKPHLSKKILQQNQKILDIQSSREIVNKY